MNSPDLNPIEHVWDELGCRVQRNHAIHTVNDLAAAVQAEWAKLPVPFIQRYVNSMRRHITLCMHKMVDTQDTDTFHSIFSLFLLVDTASNEFRPILVCNCVLQN